MSAGPSPMSSCSMTPTAGSGPPRCRPRRADPVEGALNGIAPYPAGERRRKAARSASSVTAPPSPPICWWRGRARAPLSSPPRDSATSWRSARCRATTAPISTISSLPTRRLWYRERCGARRPSVCSSTARWPSRSRRRRRRLIADGLESEKVEAVAVCFINSHANPAHERRMLETLRRRLDGRFVTASCDVNPEMFEYERTSTTVINAMLGPKCGRYFRTFRDRRERGGCPRRCALHAVEWRPRQARGGGAPAGIAAGIRARRRRHRGGEALPAPGPRQCHHRRHGRHHLRRVPGARRPRRDAQHRARCTATPCASPPSTSNRSAPAAARSPGSTMAAASMWGRKAPAPIRAPPATAAAAPIPR